MSKKVKIIHGHLFCGAGGGAKGFNQGQAKVGDLEAEFECAGGIDIDQRAIKDFEKLSGSRGTVLDMFDRAQYIDFHGKEPPAGWREATTADIHRAMNGKRPNILFLSAPCKGFSGLLNDKTSKTKKYQALNRLTLRGIWLALEAYKDDPTELIVFENVPLIRTRGRHLLDQICGLLRAYGYAVAETTHDCGELGGLGQSRKRFLLVARHMEKIQPFLYTPVKKPLRSVGEVIGRFPMPGDLTAGPMHRIPALQWKTWVRLAFVEAGKDWRSLKRLRVKDGYLQDYMLVPGCRRGYLGVNHWDEPSGTVIGRSLPNNGKNSIADPRIDGVRHNNIFRVVRYDQHSPAVTGGGGPSAGGMGVADPRYQGEEYAQFGVKKWEETSATVTSQRSPGQGPISIADPRGKADKFSGFGVQDWEEPSKVIAGESWPSNGAYCIADPRRSNVAENKPATYGVLDWEETAGAIAGESRPSNGRYAVADPRTEKEMYRNYLGTTKWDDPSVTIRGRAGPGNGRFNVADPRMKEWSSGPRNGVYGVVPWESPAGTVVGDAKHDNSKSSVADPRLPNGDQRIVCRIIAEDGTWHRPFTTLELAALQGLVCPEEHLELEGLSDSAWRERIGNAVPPPAAAAIASEMGRTLLLAWSGQTFALGSTEIWVRPLAVALSVGGI